MRIKTLHKNTFAWGIIIHAIIIWSALALGYKSYERIMYGIDPLTRDVRDSIKAVFPGAVLAFSGLYAMLRVMAKGRNIFLTIRQYIYVIIAYAVLLNLFFYSKGKDILIPFNLSIIYAAILPLLYISLHRTKTNAQDWVPPVIYKSLSRDTGPQTGTTAVSSGNFIIAFMSFMIISVVFLIFHMERIAEHLADIAYFSLVIGVGIELYNTFKRKDAQEK